MNLYLNGVEDFSIVREDTLSHPAFVDGSRLRKFDIVLANPPYSIKQWNREAFAHDYWGRNMFGTPPQGYADYAFIQHIIASMKEGTGRCAILLPHGILNRIVEADIRKKLVESDVIDAIISIGKNLFFNSPMEACILLCRTTKPAEKKGKILFVNARDLVVQQTGNAYLSEDHIRTIANLYNSCSNVEGRSRIVENDEIYQAKDISLSVSLYVGKHLWNEYLSLEDEIAEWDSQTRIMNNQYTN